jgi:DNA-binding beta-propeller fold protein YncE
MQRNHQRFGILLIGLCWLAGCQTTTLPPAPPAPNIVWPAPPEEPRVAYVRSFHQPADAGIKRSKIGRFFTWLTGASVNDQLAKPFGLALDEQDNLCITDTGANAVIFHDRQKKTWQRWNHIGKLWFSAPVAAAKTNGVIFVADPGLGQVVAFDTAGKLRWSTRTELKHPAALAVAGGKLFVADAHQHRVAVFDLAGKYLTAFGKRGTGPGEFNFPTHIATDRADHLLVTDSMNSRVQVFDCAGKFQSQLGSPGDAPGFFSRPKGVAVDSFGHVYVVDANFDNLQIFDPQGHFLLAVGEAGVAPGKFWLPNGIVISRQDEIFVADCYNHRVQIMKYVGQP